MRATLVTNSNLAAILSQVTALTTYVAQNVEPYLVVVGSALPTAEQRALPWVKTFADGSLDGLFTFDTAEENWYSLVERPVGMIAMFPAGATIELGWVAVPNSTVGLTSLAGSYQFLQFTGTGLLAKNGLFYRRYDQPLLS
jgi:hypothetical protein